MCSPMELYCIIMDIPSLLEVFEVEWLLYNAIKITVNVHKLLLH